MSLVNIDPGQISTSSNGAHTSEKITVLYVSYVQCGGVGDCFFKSISRGFADSDIVRTHIELRKMLGD